MLTVDDIKRQRERIKQQEEQRLEDANNRKKIMQQHEDERKRNEKPSDLEEVSEL